MTKPTTTPNDIATVGAQLIAPEASPEQGQNGGVSGWRDCKLGEFIFFQRGHDLPKTEMKAGSFPVAGSNGIIGYHDQFTTKSNGITIGRSGNIGTPHYYDIDFWAHNTVLYVKDFFGNNPKFSYYFLKTLDLQAFNSGSAVPTLNRNHIHELQIVVPPLDEQKAIAAVLSSLDDKIDLLHRQNQTLEAMAQTLFRQWFIEEAREDWEEVPLSILFEISSGKGLSKENFLDDGIYRVLGANGIIGRTDNYNFFEKLIYTGRVGTLGNIFIINTEPVWLSDNTLVMRNIKYFYFTYFTLKNSNLKDYNAGSTQPLLRQSDLKEIPYLQPPVEKMQEFESFAAINFTKIETNTKQIQTLNQLRDTLLPKLMSGEIRVEVEYE